MSLPTGIHHIVHGRFVPSPDVSADSGALAHAVWWFEVHDLALFGSAVIRAGKVASDPADEAVTDSTSGLRSAYQHDMPCRKQTRRRLAERPGRTRAAAAAAGARGCERLSTMPEPGPSERSSPLGRGCSAWLLGVARPLQPKVSSGSLGSPADEREKRAQGAQRAQTPTSPPTPRPNLFLGWGRRRVLRQDHAMWQGF